MNVTFEEQAPTLHTTFATPRGIVGWMLRNNVAQSASQAQTTLVVVAVLFLALSGFMARGVFSTDTIDTAKNFVPATTR